MRSLFIGGILLSLALPVWGAEVCHTITATEDPALVQWAGERGTPGTAADALQMYTDEWLRNLAQQYQRSQDEALLQRMQALSPADQAEVEALIRRKARRP